MAKTFFRLYVLANICFRPLETRCVYVSFITKAFGTRELTGNLTGIDGQPDASLSWTISTKSTVDPGRAS